MCNSNRSPQCCQTVTKNRTPGTCLATTAYNVYLHVRAAAQCSLLFLVWFNNSITPTSFKFTELHTLTLATSLRARPVWFRDYPATCSYGLLIQVYITLPLFSMHVDYSIHHIIHTCIERSSPLFLWGTPSHECLRVLLAPSSPPSVVESPVCMRMMVHMWVCACVGVLVCGCVGVWVFSLCTIIFSTHGRNSKIQSVEIILSHRDAGSMQDR